MSDTQPNEQLIAHMQEWIDGKEAFLPDNIGVCIRALLEENKRLMSEWDTWYMKSIEWIAKEEQFNDELEQVWNELSKTQKELQESKEMLTYNQQMYDQVYKSRESVEAELEQVKAERDEQTKRGDSWMWDYQSCCKERESLRTELSAKDKVLLDIKYQIEQLDHPAGLGILATINSILSRYEVKE